ncbi:HD domain-containing protein, partial [Streptomyces libani]
MGRREGLAPHHPGAPGPARLPHTWASAPVDRHQVGQILGGHHGTYSQALTAHALTDPERQEPRVGHTPGWVEQRAAHLRTLHALCGNPAPPAEFGPGGACVLATGLIVLADWLASRTGWIRARHWERNHTPDANHMAMGGRSIGPTDA